MYKPSDRQVPLFCAKSRLAKQAKKRLEHSWAPAFRDLVLPILFALEDEFADMFSDIGRPNWSVARTLAIFILQEMHSVHDQAALDLLSFDSRWHYALDLLPEEAYLSRRSYVGFRSRLVEHDPDMTKMRMVFEAVGAEAIKKLKISTASQRIDSTHVTSNIRTRGRVDLFSRTILHFLKTMQKLDPSKLEMLSKSLQTWFTARTEQKGWDKAVDKAIRQKKLLQLAGWLLEIVEVLSGEPSIIALESYQLVERLFNEHCEIKEIDDSNDDRDDKADKVVLDTHAGVEQEDPDDGRDDKADKAVPDTHADVEQVDSDEGCDDKAVPDTHADVEQINSDEGRDDNAAPDTHADAEQVDSDKDQDDGPSFIGPNQQRVKVKRKPKKPGTSMQSPFDPDAGYSAKKGVGYSVQIAETCENHPDGEGPPEIITDYQVHSAGERDFGQTMPSIGRLQKQGHAPKTFYGDSHYVSGPLIRQAKIEDVDLHSPAGRGSLPKDLVGRDAFTFDDATGEVLKCPRNHPPTGHMNRTTSKERPHSPHAKLDASKCSSCPLKERCVARPPNSGKGDWHVDICDDLRARDANLAAQKTKEWQQSYRIRSGIEATNSELKRSHGLGHLRVRKLPRVTLAVASKLTACNVKRWLRVA